MSALFFCKDLQCCNTYLSVVHVQYFCMKKWPLGCVRLISFLGLVCAAFLSSLPVSLLIPALRGLSQKLDHGHRKGHTPRALQGGLIHGHLKNAHQGAKSTHLLYRHRSKLPRNLASRGHLTLSNLITEGVNVLVQR